MRPMGFFLIANSFLVSRQIKHDSFIIVILYRVFINIPTVTY